MTHSIFKTITFVNNLYCLITTTYGYFNRLSIPIAKLFFS